MLYGRCHQIYQFQWILYQVWLVEIKYQVSWKAQRNHQVLDKEVEHSQGRRRSRRWWRYPEYIWRKQQGIWFINNHPKWQTFWIGEAVQLECTWSMNDTNIQIWSVCRNKNVLNEVTNSLNTCSIKDTSRYPDIWFNELYNLNLKLKKIKQRYEKYENEMKSHVFDVLPETYRPVHVSCDVNIFKVDYNDLKK